MADIKWVDYDEFMERGAERRRQRYARTTQDFWIDTIVAIVAAMLIVVIVFGIVWGIA